MELRLSKLVENRHGQRLSKLYRKIMLGKQYKRRRSADLYELPKRSTFETKLES
jgi:hypothetical protein